MRREQPLHNMGIVEFSSANEGKTVQLYKWLHPRPPGENTLAYIRFILCQTFFQIEKDKIILQVYLT